MFKVRLSFCSSLCDVVILFVDDISTVLNVLDYVDSMFLSVNYVCKANDLYNEIFDFAIWVSDEDRCNYLRKYKIHESLCYKN
jgi:hypothetical protein